MSDVNATNANMPNPGVPFLDGSGRISRVWWAFLLSLFQRSGGVGPAPVPGITLDDVFAIEQTYGMPPPPADRLLEMIFAPAVAVLPVANQTFVNGTDFTPGTTTALTLGNSFASASQLWVFFDGTFQGDDQYSLSGTTLTFTDVIPVGVSKVYVKGLR
jgi:hypothetical protein